MIHQFLCCIAHPLHLCTTATSLMWTQEADDAFSRLKFALMEASLLIYPQLDAVFVCDTDASSTDIGVVLSPQVHGQERVVAYFSRALSTAECHYCVTCRELLAMMKAIKCFHAYLYERKFHLHSNQSVLRWLLNFQYPEGQIARWMENLQQYDYAIEHRPGA